MKNKLLKFITACAFAASLTAASLCIQAEDKPATSTEGKKDGAIPFRGKINEIDKTAKTISIGKEKKRTIQITDKTKITKAGKAAKLDDASIDEEVAGTYRESAAGKLEAASLRIGPKPESGVKVETKKKKE